MKRTEIYHLIEDLLSKNKFDFENKNRVEADFASNYYRSFIRKNKLFCRNKNIKMRQLMRNFEELESYVDISSLFYELEKEIASRLSKQKKQIHRSSIKCDELRKGRETIGVCKAQQTKIVNQMETIKKANKYLLSKTKKGQHLNHNNLIEYLEQNSTEMQNIKYRNNSNMYTYHEITNKKIFKENKWAKISRKQSFSSESAQEDAFSNQNKQKKNRIDWHRKENVFDQINQRQNSDPFDEILKKQTQSKERQIGINIIENQRLMRLISSHLLVILEKLHQKKWIERTKKGQTQQIQRKNNNKEQKKVNLVTQTPKKTFIEDQKTQTISIFNQQFLEDSENKQITQINERKSFNVRKNKNLKKIIRMKTQFREKRTFNQKQSTPKEKSLFKIKTCIEDHRKNEFKQTKRFELSPSFKKNNSESKKYSETNKNSLKSQGGKRKLVSKEINETERINKAKIELKESFTFKKRQKKEKVLRKLKQFFLNLDNIERFLIEEDKGILRKLDILQESLDIYFQRLFHEEIIEESKIIEKIKNFLRQKNKNQLIKCREKKKVYFRKKKQSEAC